MKKTLTLSLFIFSLFISIISAGQLLANVLFFQTVLPKHYDPLTNSVMVNDFENMTIEYSHYVHYQDLIENNKPYTISHSLQKQNSKINLDLTIKDISTYDTFFIDKKISPAPENKYLFLDFLQFDGTIIIPTLQPSFNLDLEKISIENKINYEELFIHVHNTLSNINETLSKDFSKESNIVFSNNKTDLEKPGLIYGGSPVKNIHYAYREGFPVEDNFSKLNQMFSEVFQSRYLIWGLVFVIPAFITFLLIHSMIPRTKRSLAVLPTEVLLMTQLFILIFVAVLSNYIARALGNYMLDGPLGLVSFYQGLFGIGIALFIFIGILLIFYFQWVNKFKSHSIINDMIIVRTLRLITKTFKKRSQQLTLISLSLIGLFICFILIFGFTLSPNLFSLLLLIGFFGFLFNMILKMSNDQELIRQGLNEMANGNLDTEIPLDQISVINTNLVSNINAVSKGLSQGIEEKLKHERLQSQLMTNISHDLKNPLTSIISYIDLLKNETSLTEKQSQYIEILERKSNQLKDLTSSVLEFSKLHTNGQTDTTQVFELTELFYQCMADYQEKFEEKGLTVITNFPHPIEVIANPISTQRVFDNLLKNIEKYSLENTRVYALWADQSFVLKNISKQPLQLSSDELLERFVKGDDSRHEEGFGLGLAITKEFMIKQNGSLKIETNGDLFQSILMFNISEK